MPEKGPVLVDVLESFSVFGQRGGSSDSDFTEISFKSGEKINVEVRPKDGCMILSTKEGMVYLPIGETTHPFFGRDLPTDRQILEAHTGITLIEQLPDFLKKRLDEQIGETY